MSNHNTLLDSRRVTRMDRIDKMHPEIRALVHEYGLTIVQAFTDVGNFKPKQIRHIIETVLSEMSPLRQPTSSQRGNNR